MPTAHTIEGISPPGPGGAVRVSVDGKAIAVFNLGGSFYGLDAACTHVGGPLEKGHVDAQGVVTCPWHGSQFELKSGQVKRGPASRNVASYTVRVEGTKLIVELP